MQVIGMEFCCPILNYALSLLHCPLMRLLGIGRFSELSDIENRKKQLSGFTDEIYEAFN